MVGKAVREGLLPRARDCKCVDCANPAHHYDHRDYNKPLDVESVCSRCNQRRGPAVKYDWGRDILGILKKQKEAK